MNSLPIAVRLISAAIAASVTFLLLGTVVSIAEPQRSVLMAKTERADKLASAPVALALASNVTTVNGK
jgi:hypothetical protein